MTQNDPERNFYNVLAHLSTTTSTKSFSLHGAARKVIFDLLYVIEIFQTGRHSVFSIFISTILVIEAKNTKKTGVGSRLFLNSSGEISRQAVSNPEYYIIPGFTSQIGDFPRHFICVLKERFCIQNATQNECTSRCIFPS